MPIVESARVAGVSKTQGYVIRQQSFGMPPRVVEPTAAGRGRYLTSDEREDIAGYLSAGKGPREIGRLLHRSASTISRESRREGAVGPSGWYRAGPAHRDAVEQAKRPKLSKVVRCPELAAEVQRRLTKKHSPEQISARLRVDFPDDDRMRISHEAIYQSIYVQSRGGLRRELGKCLRTGRSIRRQHRHSDQRRARNEMVSISERPAEVQDRAVPGHWEGDLIVGAYSRSAIGTLVERTTRWTMLLYLPVDHSALAVQQALKTQLANLPFFLRKSLTWDQGAEMSNHLQIASENDLRVYFCDPHSPWQRGTNENTNGLLRQYFPKGTDLSVHSLADLAAATAELNDRPRKVLNWKTPAEAFQQLLSAGPIRPGVATTD
jgi:IS30 family transposase